MKTIKFLIIILLLMNGSAFGQAIEKTTALLNTGITTEGHDLKFSAKFLDKTNQFIEVEAGMGVFCPNDNIKQTVSSGFTFNKGKKQHFFSVGLHLTYATNEIPELAHLLTQETYVKSPLIGYHYATTKVGFKIQFQPLSSFSNKSKGILPATSITFGCRI